mgnify:CR=1 FL=1|tara:strand:- start:305 stop:466 length:162 start_codon:yes stop_codon:yes gene_type:complete
MALVGAIHQQCVNKNNQDKGENATLLCKPKTELEACSWKCELVEVIDPKDATT